MKLNIKIKLFGGFLVVVGLMVLRWRHRLERPKYPECECPTTSCTSSCREDQQLRDAGVPSGAARRALLRVRPGPWSQRFSPEARFHTQIIRDEALLLEEELAGEPEMLALLAASLRWSMRSFTMSWNW